MTATRAPRNGTRTKTRTDDPANEKAAQLAAFTAEPATALTTNQAVAVPDNHNTLKAGLRGPALAEDFILREKLAHFDHERIPERVVNARGCAAHGYFQVYKSQATVTAADFLQDPEVRTPVFVRFSTTTGASGSADTVRDVRGFAVKFYTRQGNYDLVGASMPVFYIQDPMKFPDLVHALKPEPHHAMPQASSAHDTFWDFASLVPETTHMLMWTMSDRGIPRSLRMMEGFGVHTFRFTNARGDSHFVRFHWKPKLGAHALTWDEAQKIAGKDPDFHRRDLWDAIEHGHFPEWELGVQMVEESNEHDFGFDLLDPTKLIPEELVPVEPIGRLVLNRNPDNYFAETEQVAFHPAHLVPGIDFSNDPLLQGRLLSYGEAQRARLGGPNLHELPINRAVCPFHNFQRDGTHRQTINRGRVAYEPNSLASGSEFRVDGGSQGFQSHEDALGSPKVRRRSPSFDDHFSQATLFWNSQTPAEKEHLIAAFRYELSKVEVPEIRQRVVDNLAHVDPRLAKKVAAPLGIDAPDAKAAAGRSGFRNPPVLTPAQPTPETSAALSIAVRPQGSVATRRVAVLVADGIDAPATKPLIAALEDAGMVCKTVANRLGAVTTAGGRRMEIDHTFATMPSVMFDAVVVAGGKECAEALVRQGDAVHFVMEAYRHCKAIGAVGEGVALLKGVGIDAGSTAEVLADHPGVVLGEGRAEEGEALAKAFVEAVRAHRHWDRSELDAIAA